MTQEPLQAGTTQRRPFYVHMRMDHLTNMFIPAAAISVLAINYSLSSMNNTLKSIDDKLAPQPTIVQENVVGGPEPERYIQLGDKRYFLEIDGKSIETTSTK